MYVSCPSCEDSVPAGNLVCKNCGWRFPPAGKVSLTSLVKPAARPKSQAEIDLAITVDRTASSACFRTGIPTTLEQILKAVAAKARILIIASPGMGRACPSGYTAQGPKALANSWDFQKRVYASTTMRDQARRHPSGGNDHEILQPTAPILLRHRSPCEINVSLYSRSGWHDRPTPKPRRPGRQLPRSNRTLPRRSRRRVRVHVRLVLGRRSVRSAQDRVRSRPRSLPQGHSRRQDQERQALRPAARRQLSRRVRLSARLARNSRSLAATQRLRPPTGLAGRAHPEHQQPVQPAGLRQEARLRRQPRGTQRRRRFTDASVRLSIETHLALIDKLDEQIHALELHLERHAKIDDANQFHRLRSIPGVGKILALVFLYEIHDIRRFPQVGNFLSYCRLVRAKHESAGKSKSAGKGAKKIGNAHLRWAIGEAVCLWIRSSDRAKAWMKRHEKKRGKAKALAILGAKLARAMYHLLRKKEVFNEAKALGG